MAEAAAASRRHLLLLFQLLLLLLLLLLLIDILLLLLSCFSPPHPNLRYCTPTSRYPTFPLSQKLLLTGLFSLLTRTFILPNKNFLCYVLVSKIKIHDKIILFGGNTESCVDAKKQASCVSNISSTCALMIGAVYQSVEWSATSASCTNSQRLLLLLLSAAKLHHTKTFVLSLLSLFFDQKQFAGMLSKFEVRAKSRIKWVWIKIVESRLRSLGPGFPPTTVEKCAAMCSVLCSVCRLCIALFRVKFVLCSVL